MIKGLASMVAPKIRVNSVSPGLLETVSETCFPAPRYISDKETGLGRPLYNRTEGCYSGKEQAEEICHRRGKCRPTYFICSH